MEELQGGNVVKQFTYGHDLISQRCVAPSVNCTLSFYGYDGHGSVRQLTDVSASVTDTYDYDAFGNLIHRSGTTSNDYLYTGEQFDANLGFYYLRARYMDPWVGRFMSLDSFEGSLDPLSLHKYLYAGSDPVNKSDPSGLFFSIGEASVATQIQSTLVNIQSTVGFKVMDALSSVLADSEIDVVSLWDSLNFVPLATLAVGAIGKLTPVVRSGERGFVSGFKEILKKSRLVAAGDSAIGAEIRAAKAFRETGSNVHFQTAAGDLGIQSVRSSDLLVGGQRGTGLGGVRYEVYSPTTDRVSNIAREIRGKLSQSDHLVLDLTRTNLSPADFDNIITRVNNMGGVPASTPLREVIFLYNDKFLGKIP